MKLLSPLRVHELADRLNADLLGNKNLQIEGINEIHKVEPGDLTFVDHPKYYDAALQSSASVVLIDQTVECPDGKALVVSDDPFRDFNWLVKRHRLNNQLPVNGNHLHEDIEVDHNSTIFPGVYLGNQVKLGNNVTIHPNAVIYAGTEIGDNVVIHSNATIGADAFYFKNRGTYHDKLESSGKVVIESDVEIGAGCTIDKGVSGITRIGKGTKLDNQVHIGHGVVVGQHCLMAAQVGIGGKTVIEDHVTLWGQVAINKSIRIGAKAEILACSGVSKSLPGHTTYFGAPAVEKKQAYQEVAAMRKLPKWMKEVQEQMRQWAGKGQR